MSERNQEKEKYERKIRERIKKLVLDLCVNGELNDRIKCMDKALEWNNDELINYISKSLPKSERQIYLKDTENFNSCLLYTSPSPRDRQKSRMPSSA